MQGAAAAAAGGGRPGFAVSVVKALFNGTPLIGRSSTGILETIGFGPLAAGGGYLIGAGAQKERFEFWLRAPRPGAVKGKQLTYRWVHVVSAAYSGTPAVGPSRASILQAVDHAPSEIALVAFPSPQLVEAPVMITAVATSLGSPVPAGSDIDLSSTEFAHDLVDPGRHARDRRLRPRRSRR